MSDLATLTCSGAIATLSLNRPDARNALSIDLLQTLNTRADELARRTDVLVVVLTGTGKAFCAGMDLKAVTSDEGLKAGLPLKLLTGLAEFTLALRRLPQAIVAKVNGAAIGGGCGLACVADIAITHADSKMGFPEVDLGVCPAVVAPWLVRKIGPGRARRVLLSGGLMSGQQAFEVGMVDRVVGTVAGLEEAVNEVASRLAAGGPNALRVTKGLLNEIDGSLDESLLERAATLSAQVLVAPESQRMLRARLGS